MSASALHLRALSTAMALLALSVLLAQCSDAPPQPTAADDPRFQPVLSPSAAKKVKTQLRKPQRGRRHRLIPAEDRILGVHVPARFELRKRSPGKAYGTVVSKTRHIKAFYTSLEYQIVEQRAGLRIYPTARSTHGLDPISKDLAKNTYIALVRDKNLVWSLQIHAPPPTLSKEDRPDPMEFILNTLHKAQKQSGIKEPVLVSPTEDEDADTDSTDKGTTAKSSSRATEKSRPASRRHARPAAQRKIYIQPKGAVNLRPGLRRWNKEHPDKPFLD